MDHHSSTAVQTQTGHGRINGYVGTSRTACWWIDRNPTPAATSPTSPTGHRPPTPAETEQEQLIEQEWQRYLDECDQDEDF